MDGKIARISSKTIDKLTSGKAMGKSKDNGFTEREHFESITRIGKLYEQSKFISSAPDKNGSSDVISVKRYDTRFKLRNGKKAIAHITVKEYKGGDNLIYSLELCK